MRLPVSDFPISKFYPLVHRSTAETWQPGINAAVLVPLLVENSEWHLLFTKRTNTIQHHKGQISFPGGRAEQDDPDPVSTALRETYEEIGLYSNQIEVLGMLQDFYTPTNLHLHPVLGRMDWPVNLRLSDEEVSKVFTIPLEWFTVPENLSIKKFKEPEKPERSAYFFTEYDGEVVWGITANIIVNLVNLIVASPSFY